MHLTATKQLSQEAEIPLTERRSVMRVFGERRYSYVYVEDD